MAERLVSIKDASIDPMELDCGHTPWVMADPPPTLTSHHRQEMSGTVLSVGHTLKLDLIMEES